MSRGLTGRARRDNRLGVLKDASCGLSAIGGSVLVRTPNSLSRARALSAGHNNLRADTSRESSWVRRSVTTARPFLAQVFDADEKTFANS